MDGLIAIGAGLGLRLIIDIATDHNRRVGGVLVGLWEGFVLQHFIRQAPRSIDPYLGTAVRVLADFLFTQSTSRAALTLIWTVLGVLMADMLPSIYRQTGLKDLYRSARRATRPVRRAVRMVRLPSMPKIEIKNDLPSMSVFMPHRRTPSVASSTPRSTRVAPAQSPRSIPSRPRPSSHRRPEGISSEPGSEFSYLRERAQVVFTPQPSPAIIPTAVDAELEYLDVPLSPSPESSISQRVERAERAERAERTERTKRTERAERTERTERADRTERAERPERAERTEPTERIERTERSVPREQPPPQPSQPSWFATAGVAALGVGAAMLTDAIEARLRKPARKETPTVPDEPTPPVETNDPIAQPPPEQPEPHDLPTLAELGTQPDEADNVPTPRMSIVPQIPDDMEPAALLAKPQAVLPQKPRNIPLPESRIPSAATARRYKTSSELDFRPSRPTPSPSKIPVATSPSSGAGANRKTRDRSQSRPSSTNVFRDSMATRADTPKVQEPPPPEPEPEPEPEETVPEPELEPKPDQEPEQKEETPAPAEPPAPLPKVEDPTPAPVPVPVTAPTPIRPISVAQRSIASSQAPSRRETPILEAAAALFAPKKPSTPTPVATPRPSTPAGAKVEKAQSNVGSRPSTPTDNAQSNVGSRPSTPTGNAQSKVGSRPSTPTPSLSGKRPSSRAGSLSKHPFDDMWNDAAGYTAEGANEAEAEADKQMAKEKEKERSEVGRPRVAIPPDRQVSVDSFGLGTTPSTPPPPFQEFEGVDNPPGIGDAPYTPPPAANAGEPAPALESTPEPEPERQPTVLTAEQTQAEGRRGKFLENVIALQKPELVQLEEEIERLQGEGQEKKVQDARMKLEEARSRIGMLTGRITKKYFSDVPPLIAPGVSITVVKDEKDNMPELINRIMRETASALLARDDAGPVLVDVVIANSKNPLKSKNARVRDGIASAMEVYGFTAATSEEKPGTLTITV